MATICVECDKKIDDFVDSDGSDYMDCCSECSNDLAEFTCCDCKKDFIGDAFLEVFEEEGIKCKSCYSKHDARERIISIAKSLTEAGWPLRWVAKLFAENNISHSYVNK